MLQKSKHHCLVSLLAHNEASVECTVRLSRRCHLWRHITVPERVDDEIVEVLVKDMPIRTL